MVLSQLFKDFSVTHVTLVTSLKSEVHYPHVSPRPNLIRPATRVRCQYNEGDKPQIKPCKLGYIYAHDKESKTCWFMLEKSGGSV